MSRRRSNRRPRPQPNTALREGVYDALLDGSGVDVDDWMYRSLTGGNRGNNLPEFKHEKMLSIARYIGRTNPVANRMLTMISDFVLGEGVTYSCQNDEVRDVLDAYWRDPDNDWSRNNAGRLRRFLRDGCYLMPLFPNPVNGSVTIGSVPAEWIAGVETDPENWERVASVHLKKRAGEADGKVYTIVNRCQSAADLEGVTNPALYWTFGNDDGHRGISILYPTADYMDMLDQMLFSEVERWLLQKAFVWDVSVSGLDASQLAKFKKDNPELTTPPKPGSALVHNDGVTLTAISPKLETADAVNGIRFVRNHIFGNQGIPEHFYAEGGDVNRSVGTVMAEVPRKRFTALQDEWRYVIQDALQTQIDYAVISGTLPAEVEVQGARGQPLMQKDADGNPTTIPLTMPAREAFDIRMPDLSGDDVAKLMPAIQQLAATLALAEGEEYVSKTTARTAFLTFLGQIGVDINIEEEAERAEADAMARKAAAAQIAQTMQPPTQLAALAPRAQRPGDQQPGAVVAVKQAGG